MICHLKVLSLSLFCRRHSSHYNYSFNDSEAVIGWLMSSFFDLPLALLHLQQVEQLTVTYQLGGKRARAETDCSEAPGQVLGGGARAGFHFHEAVVCFLDLGIS